MSCEDNKKPLKVWYDRPAKDQFTSAIPVGNGFMGAMVYGNVQCEKISLNDGTFWSGGPGNNNRPGASDYLGECRKHLFEGDYKTAQDIVTNHMIGFLEQSFLPVGNLNIMFHGHENFEDYRRELDLSCSAARVSYNAGGINYTREVFASYPDKVITVRLSADQKAALNFSVGFDSSLSDYCVATEGNNAAILNGKGEDRNGSQGAVHFQARACIINDGGSIKADSQYVSVENGDAAVIYITIGTNFNSYNDISGNPEERAKTMISKALGKTYEELLNNHISDYKALFDRVELNLDGRHDYSDQPVDKRLEGYVKNRDTGFIELYYQFGRYLMISCSRPGGQPANLQGIWNEEMFAPWDSKYTTNINFEMNYWPSYTGNLRECTLPFVDKIRNLVGQGSETAKVHYNIDMGWVLHHNTDLWNRTAPIDGPWGFTPAMGAWLCNQLFDFYLFNCEKAYLEEIYPVMKGAAEFLVEFLVSYKDENGKTYLVTAPSASPENMLRAGFDTATCFAPTMDNEILRELFSNCMRASETMGIDEGMRCKWNEIINKLPPARVGRWGQLQEWFGDWDFEGDDHRHISHLYGLFPGRHITPENTPELVKAAKVTLNARGDMSTGWSLAWKINVWARLQDGDHCMRLIDLLLSPERTYTNLFDAHPPFQIDGNFGAVSGINEMLVQSHNGTIRLLPALPTEWQSGYVKGLLARGGFEISMLRWEKGKLAEAEIYSASGSECKICYGEKSVAIKTEPGKKYVISGSMFI